MAADAPKSDAKAPRLAFRRVSEGPDVEAVRRLAAEIWPPTFGPILPPAQIPYMMEMMYATEVVRRELADGVRWELVELDGEPVGYLSWGPCPGEGHDGTAKLHKVYLLPRLHSQGIGRAMLRHAVAECRAEGFGRVVLAVNKRNDRAIRAYRRFGFRVAEKVKNDIGGGFFMDDFVMAFDLREGVRIPAGVRKWLLVLNTVGFAIFLVWHYSLRDAAIMREQDGILYYLPCLPFLFVYLLLLGGRRE